jgi:hypothetical protein
MIMPRDLWFAFDKKPRITFVLTIAYYPQRSSATTPITSSLKGAFSANFTMVKPDDSELYIHSINIFVSNEIIVGGGDIVITGIGNIYPKAL